jgi:hypothetical protein
MDTVINRMPSNVDPNSKHCQTIVILLQILKMSGCLQVNDYFFMFRLGTKAVAAVERIDSHPNIQHDTNTTV